jgi:hypothetical protein
MRGIVEPDFLRRINGTMICLTCAILCHTLRAWQTGVYTAAVEFKPDTVGGEYEPEPYSLSRKLIQLCVLKTFLRGKSRRGPIARAGYRQ